MDILLENASLGHSWDVLIELNEWILQDPIENPNRILYLKHLIELNPTESFPFLYKKTISLALMNRHVDILDYLYIHASTIWTSSQLEIYHYGKKIGNFNFTQFLVL